MQTNPAIEQNKNIRWSESPWNQSGRRTQQIRNNKFQFTIASLLTNGKK